MRREKLIETAAELFRAKGYAAATVRDIAEGLGVTSAALYRHIESKEDLLREIVEHAMLLAERHLDEALAAHVPVEEKLRRVIRHHVLAVLDESQLMMAVFFQEIGLLRGRGWSRLDARRTRYQERIVALFEDAAKDGVLRVGDPRVAVYGILGMGNWLYRWYRPGGRFTPAEIAGQYADMVLDGLLIKPP